MSMHYKQLPAGQESLFAPENFNPENRGQYGMWGYPGFCITEALHQRDEAKIKECFDRGYIAPDSRCLDDSTLIEYCADKGKTRSVECLRKLGFE